MNKKEKIKQVTTEIKNGASLKSTAKKYNLPLSTVAYWCKINNIKSKHAPYPQKATDDEIINIIKKNKVMTAREIENHFNYHKNALSKRLKKLVLTKKIDYILIPGGGGKPSMFFKGYIDTMLYYVNKSDLYKWIKQQLPKHIPMHLRRAISQRFKACGIDFEFEKKDKKSVVIPKKVYERIKNKANKKGLTISEYIQKIA